MPLFLHENIEPKGEIGMWDITEGDDFFVSELVLTYSEAKMLEEVIAKRRKEWMAGRLLLHRMSGRKERGLCVKDEYGKPFLENSPFDISLSHSGRFAAVVAAPNACGVDVQRLVEKLRRIEGKFMREEEFACLAQEKYLEHLHVFWGAKEAMYKAYGKKKLEFREHILVEPFEYDVTFGRCKGYVRKADTNMEFDIRYRLIENYMLVYAIEI